MTISEFHTEFKISLDKTDSLNYPDLLPEEIDVFLNKAIERFVHQRLYGTNAKGEGVEETQKRVDDLITLVVNATIAPTSALVSTDAKPNGSQIILPANYWHALQEEAIISYADCNNVTTTARVPVYPITHDQYNKVIRDPFNKPDETGILRLTLDGAFEAISSTGVTLTSYILRYAKKPDTVKYGTAYTPASTDVQCNLPIHTHKEIIALAVVDALQNIEQLKRVPVEFQQVATQE